MWGKLHVTIIYKQLQVYVNISTFKLDVFQNTSETHTAGFSFNADC